MRTLFAQPGYARLFAGTAAATIGDSLLLLVLAIWVKDLTGSDGAAGITLFFYGAPMLAAPLFGMLVDRFRNRPFLVVANVVNATFLIPLAFVGGSADVWLIYLTALLLGVGSTVDSPALNGLLKRMLPAELLVQANSASQTVQQGMRLAGPLVGAGLYLVGGGIVVAAVDAACLLIAAATIWSLRVEEPKPAPRPAESRWLPEILAGFRFVAADGALKRITLGMFLAGCAIGAVESVGFALTDKGLGQPPEFISVIVTVMGIGGLLGGLTAAKVVTRLGEVAAAALSMALIALTCLVWVIPQTVVVLVITPVVGYALPILVVAANTLVQRRSPQELIGRVSSVTNQSISVPQVFSIALGALLVSVLDYRFVLLGMAVLFGASAVYLFLGRRLSRDTGATPEPEVSAEAATA
ncbi:MFS transporter [Stackebrandtia albiflava]|uniref:MFS transporter n=1 Tax=Stackebrandtia albiflava TaxID=406432 RepID=A0A562V4W0_9ACTN|nr:MFS transporter [Stackebrandtia albiflava]TWJ12910.1 MFS transporter [Stackebrandtia albiflava]